MQCPYCGYQHDSESRVCPRCDPTVSNAYYARSPLPEGTLLHKGAYRVGPVIGLGATSIVYSGLEAGLGQAIAIKEFFPLNSQRKGLRVGPNGTGLWPRRRFNRSREEFLEEGRLIARFTNPGIARVHAGFEEHDTAFLIMELLKGDTLYSRATARGGKLPPEEVVGWLAQLAPALETMHLYGLLHADLKPENLMLTEDGRAVLLDFGAAYRYLTGSDKPDQFTPAYAAPEQHPEMGGKMGPYTDVYGLGASLYEVLAGRRPASARSRARGEALEDLKRLRPEVPARLAEGIALALQFDPRRRPQSIKAFMELLGLPMEEAALVASASSGRELDCLRAHRSRLVGLDFSADGQYLASGSQDGEVWVWDILEHTRYRALVQPGLTGLLLGPDASWLVLSSADGTVRLWDLVKERDRKVLKRGLPKVEALARNRDGGWLAAAGADGCAQVWKSPGNTAESLGRHGGPIFSLALSPDGQRLATGSGDRTVGVWDLASEARPTVLAGHQGSVQGVAFSPDGELVASCSTDRTLRLWDVRTGREVRSVQCPMPLCIAFSPDAQMLAAGSLDRSVRLFDLAAGRQLTQLQHEGGVIRLAFLPDGRLATGSVDGVIRFWEVRR